MGRVPYYTVCSDLAISRRRLASDRAPSATPMGVSARQLLVTNEPTPAPSDDARTRFAVGGIRRSLRPWHISWLIGAPIAAALIWILVTSPVGPASSGGSGAAPGATFYVLGAETQGLQVGQRAPDFVGTADGKEVRLTDLDGRPVRISDFRGRPLWINFWATWCPPCRREMPSMQRAWEKLKGERFEMYAVNVGEDEDTIFGFTFSTGVELTFPILLDRDARVVKAWPVIALPTSFIVDPQGRIVYRAVGGREWDDPSLLEKIRELMPKR